jgi:uncharacterized protein (TIGR02246 family)
MIPSVHEQAVAVFTALLDAWNRRDASGFAAQFAPDGHVTGFDGSQMSGPANIATELGEIFAHHQTASYVAKVREVRSLGPTVTLLRAIAGMIPPGARALNPAVNAIQSLVLVTDPQTSHLRITLMQNTPAAFHGRPHLVTAMTEELTRVHAAGLPVAAADEL